MTRAQFERMVLAARDLLAKAAGEPLDPLTLEWARQAAVSAFVGASPKVAYQQARIVKAMANHPPEGLLACEIAAASGLNKQQCAAALSYMAKHWQVAMLKIPGRSRYFTDEPALAQGRALVEAEEARRRSRPRVKKAREKKAKKPRTVPAALKPPAVRSAVVRSRRTVQAVFKALVPDFYLPEAVPHVRIVMVPCARDTRYTALPPIEGIGAVKAWLALTGQTPRRRR